VKVELYANALPGGSPERHVMTRETGLEQASINECLFSARVPATRPAVDYTPRLIPHNDEALVPLEAFQILWQR
jgi:starch phosphorylase